MKLEMEQGDHAVLLTHYSVLGAMRSLQVVINGKPFATWYQIDRTRMAWDENYMKEVDKNLAQQFERMVGKLLDKALAEVPAGVDLLKEEELRGEPWEKQ